MNRLTKMLAVPLLLAACAVLVALMFVPACGSSESDPIAAAIVADNPDPGKPIFESNCLRCHPYGKRGTGPNLSKKDLTVEQVTKQVRKGGLIMPSFSQDEITNDQLTQLAPFVVSLKSKIGEK